MKTYLGSIDLQQGSHKDRVLDITKLNQMCEQIIQLVYLTDFPLIYSASQIAVASFRLAAVRSKDELAMR